MSEAPSSHAGSSLGGEVHLWGVSRDASVLADTALAKRLGEGGRSSVREFSAETMVDRTTRTYGEILTWRLTGMASS